MKLFAAKRSLFLLAMVWLSPCLGCGNNLKTNSKIAGDDLRVQIRPAHGNEKCSVDYEVVNIRKATVATDSDQIGWCVKKDAKIKYYIFFPATPFEENGPPQLLTLIDQPFPFNKACTAKYAPVDSAALPEYPYEIQSGDVTSHIKCSDPKVILK